ncbi:molybdenum cofactor guanylyltransferase MobA [Bosea sp. (in: a-proteobacteria)]|uniref:molybdenum cofactor guanylyltransferase MobA n=1 Tax=Bosea sp. (in: a-proteobacteria) TaxID=1871050 RepID=UPI003B3BE880
MTAQPQTIGLILAGGLSRRMGGGDKALLPLGGRPLLAHVAARLAPQCAELLLNANGDPARMADFALPIVPDSIPDHAGPLAGVLTGLDWLAAHRPATEWLVTAAADTPFLPPDLVARLHAARGEAGTPLACAASGDQRHHAIGLWPVSIRQALRDRLEAGERRLRAVTDRFGVAEVPWPAQPRDPFFNINTPEDRARAEAMLVAADPIR